VRSVEISLADGKGTIEGLEIANPDGFDGGRAMALESLSIAFDVAASTTELVVIDQLSVAGAKVEAVVGADGKTNFGAIMDNLDQAGAADSTEAASDAIKFIIERFDFTAASASATAPLLDKSVELAIKDVHVKDIGKASGGATASEVGQALMQPIVKAVVSGIKSSGVAAARQSLERSVNEKMKGGLDQLRQLGHPTN
jgi:hypothetical protein